jgi:hypothetical protein
MTVVHVPRLPGSAHAWHWPLQGESQHTPSTQKPLVHWFAAAHALPFIACVMQTPFEQ